MWGEERFVRHPPITPSLAGDAKCGHDAAITKTIRWLMVLAPGVLLYILPVPALNPAQRHLLAIFTATVISLVAQPVTMGVTALIALTTLALTRTVSTSQVF